MATVIDALLVELSLDPTKFKKGEKEAAEAMLRTRNEVDKTQKAAQNLEKAYGETFEGMTRRAVTFFAVLAGAKSVTEFTTKLIANDAALGRLAVTLGVLPQDLSAMTGAVERNGGSVEAATASFKSLSDQFEELKINGNAGILPMLQKLQGVGGKNIDVFHGFSAALPGIADNLKALKDAGKDIDADFYARALGLDQETAIELEKGWARFSEDVARYKKENPPDTKWTKSAQELVESWNDAKRALQGFGRYFVETFSPLMRHEMKLLIDILHADLKGMFKDWTNIIGDIGNFTNQAYHKLTGKWIFDPNEGMNGGRTLSGGGGGEGYSLPGGGGTGGLRSRRGEWSGNDALRMRAQRGGIHKGGWWSPERQKYAVDRLVSGGMSELGAAALVSRWKNVESTRDGPNAVNSIGMRGIAQMDHHRWSKVGGAKSFDDQLDAVLRELNDGSEARAATTLRLAKTPGEAARGASQYERAEGWSPGRGTDNFAGATEAGIAEILRNARPPVVPPIKPGTELPLFHPNTGMPAAGVAAPTARTPMDVYGDLSGAAHAFHQTNNDHSQANTTTNSVSVGQVHVHTQATDGEGIAKSIKPALQRHSFAIQANHGPN